MSRYDYAFNGNRLFHVIDTQTKSIIYKIDFKNDIDFQDLTSTYVDHLRMMTRMYNSEHELYTNEIMKYINS